MYFDIRQRAFEPAYFYKNLKKIQDLDDQTFLSQLVINEISILFSILFYSIQFYSILFFYRSRYFAKAKVSSSVLLFL